MSLPVEILSEAGKKGGKGHKHYWTDEERDIVRRDYRGTNDSARQIAAKLTYQIGQRITIWAVKGQASKMGILVPKSPDWTTLELTRLGNLIHERSVTEIAKILHRSPNAVKIKATRLKLCLRARDNWFTKCEVCEILGVDHKKVQSWIDRGALKARWHTDQKPQQNGMAMWHIMVSDLADFVLCHCEELTGRNVDLQQIVWLFAQPNLPLSLPDPEPVQKVMMEA